MGFAGGNLEIKGRVRKLLKRALAHENLLKIQLKINCSEKEAIFVLKMRKVRSDIRLN